jgi:hypothetical protein
MFPIAICCAIINICGSQVHPIALRISQFIHLPCQIEADPGWILYINPTVVVEIYNNNNNNLDIFF